MVQAGLKRTTSGVAGEEALRQRATQAFSGDVPGTDGLPGALTQRFVEVRPRSDDPGVVAPLGWVLAPSTQKELSEDLEDAMRRAGALNLAAQLTGSRQGE